jgi:hypothetical protein
MESRINSGLVLPQRLEIHPRRNTRLRTRRGESEVGSGKVENWQDVEFKWPYQDVKPSTSDKFVPKLVVSRLR